MTTKKTKQTPPSEPQKDNAPEVPPGYIVHASTINAFNEFMDRNNLQHAAININVDIKNESELTKIKGWVSDIGEEIEKCFSTFVSINFPQFGMLLPSYEKGASICAFLIENRKAIVERIILRTIRNLQSSLMLGEILCYFFNDVPGNLSFKLITSNKKPFGVSEPAAEEFIDKAFKTIFYDICGKNDSYGNRQKAVVLLTDILTAHFHRKTGYELYRVQIALLSEKPPQVISISENNRTFSRVEQRLEIKIIPQYHCRLLSDVEKREMKVSYSLPKIKE